jgi:cyclophilin family peptidyl-prolyl cis-trans isomerase
MIKHYAPILFCLLSCAFLGNSQTQITFYTTMGNFVVEMSDSLTPITSGNFIDLADSGYYDGVIFHRVINNFMIQGGDPTGTGAGGPGYTIPDEFDSTGTLSNVQKAISMANSGPNTGGSQFFINLVNNTYLDYDKPPYTSKHPVFGMVIDSFNVVQAIGATPVNSQNRPITPVVMDSLRIFHADTNTQDTAINDSLDGISKVKEKENPFKVKIFPNPVGLVTVITIDSKKSQSSHIQIIDQMGRVMSSFDQPLRAGMNRITDLGLNPIDLPNGVYTLQIESINETSNQRFVVTN